MAGPAVVTVAVVVERPGRWRSEGGWVPLDWPCTGKGWGVRVGRLLVTGRVVVLGVLGELVAVSGETDLAVAARGRVTGSVKGWVVAVKAGTGRVAGAVMVAVERDWAELVEAVGWEVEGVETDWGGEKGEVGDCWGDLDLEAVRGEGWEVRGVREGGKAREMGWEGMVVEAETGAAGAGRVMEGEEGVTDWEDLEEKVVMVEVGEEEETGAGLETNGVKSISAIIMCVPAA